MKTGLDRLLNDPSSLIKKRVGFVCNPTAINHEYHHAIDLLLKAGVQLVRLFGPEHGVRATAQDMEGVAEKTDPVTGLQTVSLYGEDEQSLKPQAKHLEDLDVVLFDIQDIGTRYYTYQATLGFVMQVASTTNTKVVILDRPNPINGTTIEGNLVHPGYESFVGAFPIAIRHAMTVGELAGYFKKFCGVNADYEVFTCEGYDRSHYFDETNLPWVYPSPNMPTIDTAIIYPGMCLIEATTLSEGRGTTRPFHLVGAPGLNPQDFVRNLRQCAAEAQLQGVAFREAAFIPGFQKHAGVSCTGAEVHLTDRTKLNALLLGMVTVQAAWRTDRSVWQWRSEPYEFIADVPAIDLLTGNDLFRKALNNNTPLLDVLASYEADRQLFIERRQSCLLY